MKRTPIYGMMAEFDSAQALVDAAHRTHEAGYLKIDAYSPFPIEGLAEAIGFRKNAVPLVVLIGGLLMPQTWEGVVFGRLYLRRGLEASILAHASMDVALFALAAIGVSRTHGR